MPCETPGFRMHGFLSGLLYPQYFVRAITTGTSYFYLKFQMVPEMANKKSLTE